MSNTIVPSIYTAVMKDVIENVKKDFKDNGIEEAVLYDLERNWGQKLKGFKEVAAWTHPDGNVGEETNGSTTNTLIQSAAITEPTNASLKYQPNEFEKPPPASNLPSLAMNSDASNRMRKPQPYNVDINNAYNKSSTPDSNHNKHGITHISNSNHLNNNNHHNNNINNNNNNSLTQPQTQSLSSSSSSSITPTPPPQSNNPQNIQTNTPQTTYPDTYEKKSNTKRKSYADEDDINSDLDDSDEDEAAAEGESQNIILCLYDKVTRTKNKWKCQLKDGIMSVNGKEYLFQKGNGDFEF